MHILQSVILYPPDSFGGTEQYVHGLSQELLGSGCQVTVSATAGWEYTYTHDGVPVYRYPSTLTPSRAEMRGEVPPLHFEVFARWLREARVDVMHMHAVTRAIGLYHAELCKALGIPLVLTVHLPGITCVQGTMLHEGRDVCDGRIIPQRCAACKLHNAGLPIPLARAFSQTPVPLAVLAEGSEYRLATAMSMTRAVASWTARTKRIFELADRIVVVSQWLYNVLALNGVPTRKLLLSRHGIAEGLSVPYRTRSHADDQVLIIGFVGRFNPIKGVHLLIEAITRLPRNLPVQLLVYGVYNDVMEERYLSALKRQAGDDPRITFPGAVTAENRSTIFGSLDILAVPSQWLETGPLVVLEAFAAGIPVVGSAMGGLAELVTHDVNGLLVAPRDVAAWAAAFSRLVQEPWLLTRLSQSVPPVRTTATVASEMLDLYQQLVPTPTL